MTIETTTPGPATAKATGDLSPARVTVHIECFGVSTEHGRLVGRRVVQHQQGDPDDCAARAIGLAGGPLDGRALLHSTSWRWQDAT